VKALRARGAATPGLAPAPAAQQRDADTLEFLAELSQALAVSLDLGQTLAETVTRVADFMRVEAASLFLLDPRTLVLDCRVCVGPVDISGVRLALGQGIVGAAAAENATQLVPDAAADARVWRAADDASGFVTRSIVCAPLRTAAGPIGVLEIVNRRDGRPFAEADAKLLELVAAPAALAINNARMSETLLEQQRLKREFELARRLQKSLLPRRRREPFPIVGVNRPAHEISGDFYDYFELADGRIGFVVGDVSGKGLDAAFLMVRAASLLRWAGKDGLEPAAWLARANDELCETTQDGRFVCALVGYCDRLATEVRFAGAGFPPVVVARGGAFEEFASGGPPLGILPGMAYGQHALRLEGGTLYAFSDGATDVRDADGRPIGNAGVRELIARHAGETLETRLRALLAELKRLHLVDDTTLLLVEAPRTEDADVLLDCRMPARPETLRELRARVRAALDGIGAEPRLRDRLVLAVDEAAANVVRHAYAAQGCAGDIALRVVRSGNVVRFEMSDSAPCVERERLRPQPLGESRCGGLGLALIDEVMDHWQVDPLPGRRGNRLVMQKRIEGIGDEEGEGT